MRHRKKLKKIGLKKSHRDSLLKNLIASLVLNGKIRTTETRAKAVASRFAKLLNLVQRKEAREVMRTLPNYCANAGQGAAYKKIATELKPKYESRKSGFTRIIKIGLRKGDCASLVQLELI